MSFFDPRTRSRSHRNRKLFAAYEIAYTAVDVIAALLFIVGSVLFFWQSLSIPATWCFLIGSIFFALKPTLRIVREFHMLAEGDYEDLEEGKG